MLGPDHPDTLTSRNNLACAYQSAGELAEAIALYEQTLADRERVLGADHPDTLTSRNNLAYAYRSAGDLGRAIPLYEPTLADRERVLGADHPDTLTSRNNLAAAYESAGDGPGDPAVRADPGRPGAGAGPRPPRHPDLAQQPRRRLRGGGRTWARRSRCTSRPSPTASGCSGPDHPDTLISRNNLACAYQAVGDLGRAIPLYEPTLADRERVLGPDHPDTLTSRNNLARSTRGSATD